MLLLYKGTPIFGANHEKPGRGEEGSFPKIFKESITTPTVLLWILVFTTLLESIYIILNHKVFGNFL